VHEACPSAGYRTLLYFGALPDFVLLAEHTRAAQANWTLNLVFGGVPEEEREPERGIQAELARMDKSGLIAETSYDWYTTIAIEREVEVEPCAELISSLEREAHANTDSFLDIIVARLATAQGRRFYIHQIMDRVSYYLPGRSPLVVPRSDMRGRANLVSDPASFPQDVVKTLHEAASKVYEPLSSPCHW
jgi:hypothetical protein